METIEERAIEFANGKLAAACVKNGYIKGATDQRAIDEVELKPKWVPCSEKMPEKHGWYVGLSKNNDFPPIPCYYTGDPGWFALHEVTHWMSLPPSPSK